MLRYVLRRLAYSLLVIWGAVTMVFLIVRVIPGDPAQMYAGPLADAAQVEAARVTLGLARPLAEQYLGFLGDALTLDLGRSYRLGAAVTALLAQRIPDTALLASVAICLVVIVSFPLGIVAARHRTRRPDRVISLVSLLGQALPNFWVGIILILVFSVILGWLRARFHAQNGVPAGGQTWVSSGSIKSPAARRALARKRRTTVKRLAAKRARPSTDRESEGVPVAVGELVPWPTGCPPCAPGASFL